MDKYYYILLFFILWSCHSCKSKDETDTENPAAQTTTKHTTTTTTSASSCQSTLSYQVGINLSNNRYWSSQIIYVDAFKSSSMWVPNIADSSHPSYSTVWNTGVEIPLGTNGYPLEIPYTPTSGEWAGVGQRATKVIWGGIDGHYPTGTYTLILEGTGRLRVGNWSTNTEITNSGTHKIEITAANEGIILDLLESDAADPIRNIRFILPDYEDSYKGELLYPPFIEGLQIFNVIRAHATMGIMGYYGCDNDVDDMSADCVMTWENRAKTEYSTYATPQGIPYEIYIDIINKTNADIWVNVVHAADDNFIRNFATLIKERLHTNKKIYLELANETWNAEPTNFPQTYYFRAKGLELGLDTDATAAGRKYFVKRSIEMWAIFEEVFSDQSNRLYKVLPTQFGNDWEDASRINLLSDTAINPNGVQPDYFAGGSYFGGHFDSSVDPATISVDEVLSATEAELDLLRTRIQTTKNLAEANGMNLISYEGGQHLVNYDGSWGDYWTKLRDANRNNRMGELYNLFFDIWEDENPGQLLMLHDYVSYPMRNGGYFGVKEWVDQDITDTPKYRAIKERVCP